MFYENVNLTQLNFCYTLVGLSYQDTKTIVLQSSRQTACDEV